LAWTVEWDEQAIKDAQKLGHAERSRIGRFLRERVATDQDPRRMGKRLHGAKTGLWRYRVGDHRIICRVEDQRMVVLVLAVGHRSEIYE
jgi:mRNA interferase RelE/StbE